MASETIKKLSLEKTQGFQALRVLEEDLPEGAESFHAQFNIDPQRLKPTNFSLSKDVWNAFFIDPENKKMLQVLIDAKVNEDLGKLALEQEKKCAVLEEEAKTRGFESGRKDGHAEGHAKAYHEALSQTREQINLLCENLKTISISITEDREKLLVRHTEEWCRALEHVLKRFLVAKATDITSSIKEWIQEILKGMSVQSKIQISVGKREWDSLNAFLKTENYTGWELVLDATLNDGEIRCEWDGSGVFFSPQVQFEKLDKLLDKFLPKA